MTSFLVEKSGGRAIIIEEREALTQKEQQVYELAVTTPMEVLEIANKLKIRKSTVKTYLINIFLKLNVKSRAELIIKHYQKLIKNSLNNE